MSFVHPPAVGRRDFVRMTLAAVAGVGGALSVGACSTGAEATPQAWRTPALLDALGGDRVRRIGALWREQHPSERSLADLHAALRQRLHVTEPELDNAPADAVSRAITDDFEANRIVIVDGWLLAVTEARQCALYHLTTST